MRASRVGKEMETVALLLTNAGELRTHISDSSCNGEEL